MAIEAERWARVVARVLAGLVFCVSAVAKLVAIDDFELYVYSYGWLPLGMSYVAARLCIGWELVLSALLLTGVWKRATRTLALLTLVAFSLFLCYALLVGRNESCECMGRLVSLNPWESLLKNGVLIMIVLWGVRESVRVNVKGRRWRVVVAFVVGLVLMVMPFVVSVPDSWGFGPAREPFGEEALKEATATEGVLAKMGVGKERKLVAFVTPRCPYCKLARKKLDALSNRHHLPKGSIVYVEPGDVGDELFVEITHGARPLMLLMEGQEVRATYHLRNVDEDEVADFITGKR